MLHKSRSLLIVGLSILLCLFTIVFVNFNALQPQSALALFSLLGLLLCFLTTPTFKKANTERNSQLEPDGLNETERKSSSWLSVTDALISLTGAGLAVLCFGYIFVQTEPIFARFWPESSVFTRPVSLGERAGDENLLDYWIGVLGLVLVLEAARRTIGWVVPALAIVFILHAYFAPQLPDWLFPHQGRTPKQIVSGTFLQSMGVLGPATSVMFKFVFLFVIFGAFLEMSGATQFIIDFSHKLFHKSVGGPAKIAVLSSGLMGSLSGSAVANAVTTGAFTIPMMRKSGFKSHEAAAVEAAAGSGGAMVPPVMGAAAYMMLEFVENITFLQIVKAAIIPAALYYLSLFLIVHFHAKRQIHLGQNALPYSAKSVPLFEGLVFFGALGCLVILLVLNFSPFKAVTGSLILILLLAVFRDRVSILATPKWLALISFVAVLFVHQLSFYFGNLESLQHSLARPFLATSWIHPDGHISPRLAFESLLNSCILGALGLILFGLIHPLWRPRMVQALKSAAANGIPLIAASACVGIIIGIVQTTPVASDFSAVIKGLVESNLLLALIGIMVCSIVLGMGVPSVVCYLLMATLMGSLLSEMGVPPLAAHLFIFYYGMMSMVTPPVALAAYAAASIAQAPIMRTAMTAFRYSLVGFALPFMFVYQPALVLLAPQGETLQWMDVLLAVGAAAMGVLALSAALMGYLRRPLGPGVRVLLVCAAILLLSPNIGGIVWGTIANLVGLAIIIVIILLRPETQSKAGAT
ncbi:MAG TPA: TRAP transporter fused permease subunit [Pirellulaceae bacterium]|nr:TRAP transporter fused permease subunit [Pirellulaceae bacterium]HMO92982.1 TRAP transporter fused permease subunit [Pirellulaceae bacterium]